MAKSQKSDFQSKEDLQEYIDGLREVKSQYDSLIAKAKELANQPGKALNDIKNQIKQLEKQNDTYEEIVNSLKQAQSEYDKLSDKQEKFTQRTKKQKEQFEDLEDSLISIGNVLGKNSELYQKIEDRTKGVKEVFSSISAELSSGGGGIESKKIKEAAASYVDMQASISNAMKEQKAGNIDVDEYIQKVKDASESFSNIVSKIDLANIKSEELVKLIKEMVKESDSFSDLSEKIKMDEDFQDVAAKNIGDAFRATPELSESIDGGMDLMKAIKKGAGPVAIAAAVLAIVKGIGSLLGKLNFATVIKTEREYEGINKILDVQISQLEQIAKLNAGLVAERANLNFDEQLEQAALSFNTVSKTAFFGSGLGSVKYAKEQLELAGVGADAIVSSMSDMSMGANSGMKALGTDVAVFARKTGIASGEVAGLTGMFRMLDKTGGQEAFNTLQKSLSGVGLKGFNVADIAGELKDSAGLALEYNIKSSAELVKQVKNVRDMGASFTKIAEAGKSMVLNYKDSIRKEMELSAMLGENVDLSEARALFAAGKNDEAFAVLKSSGVLAKAQSQGLFGTQALSAALGGMDLQQLATGKYEAGPKQGIASNQQFLDTFKEAMRQQTVGNALISAKFAILAGDIDIKEEQLLRQGGINDALTELKAKQKKNETLGTIETFFKTIQNAGETLLGVQYGATTTKDIFKADKDILSKGVKTNVDISKSNQNLNKTGVVNTNLPAANTTGATLSTGMTQGIDNSNTGKSIDMQSATMVKILDRNHKSMMHLEQINTNSTALVKLTQNIQTLTATMADLPLGFAGMKLMIDGKDVKSRIEKLQTQEKGKTKT